MTDIFDIKDFFLWDWFSYINTLIILLIFIWVVSFFVFVKNKKNKIKNDFIEQKENEILDFKAMLWIFEEKYYYLDSINFLKEINHIFRLFLEQEKWYKNFSKLTLEEIISLDLQKDHISFLKDLYFKEYREQFLDQDEKKEIFTNLLKIISN